MNIEIVYGFEPLTIRSLGNRLNWNTYQQLFSSDKKEENKKGKENNKENPLYWRNFLDKEENKNGKENNEKNPLYWRNFLDK